MAACHCYWRTVFSKEGFLDEPGNDKKGQVHSSAKANCRSRLR